MGKAKRREKKLKNASKRHQANNKLNKVLKPAAVGKGKKTAGTKSKKGTSTQQPKAQIPFTSEDRVLLVGEGKHLMFVCIMLCL